MKTLSALPLLLALSAPHAACLSDAEVGALHAAYTSRAPAANPEGLSEADGECSRAKLLERLDLHAGPRAGYKAGLTNPAVQARFNAKAPVLGYVVRQHAARERRNG